MQLKQIADRVRAILADSEKSRNNDWSLYANYINRHCVKYIAASADGRKCVLLDDFKFLPPMESVTRARRIIQNEHGEYLPTDRKVLKARQIKEESYRTVEVHEAKNS